MGQFSQIGPEQGEKSYNLTVNVANAPQSLGRPSIPLTSVTLTEGILVTVVCSVAHNLSDGEIVTITGTTQPEYSGTWVVEVVDSTTFKYRINTYSTAPVSPATGATKLAQPQSYFKRALIKNATGNASTSVTFGPNMAADFDDLANMLEYLIEPTPPDKSDLSTWYMKSATVGTVVQVLYFLSVMLSLVLLPSTASAQPYFPSTPYTRGFMTNLTAASARSYLGIGAGFGTGNFDTTQFTTDWTGTNTTIKYQFITTNQMNLGGLYIGTNVAGQTAQVFIQNLTNSNVGLLVRGAGGQSVPEFRVQNSAGANRFSVSPTAISATQPIVETVGAYFGTNIGQASQVFVQNLTNTQPGLIVRAAGGQTGDILKVQNSAGTSLAGINNVGTWTGSTIGASTPTYAFADGTTGLSSDQAGRYFELCSGTIVSRVYGGERFFSALVAPYPDNTYDLGGGSLDDGRWRQLFLGPTGLKVGNKTSGPTITATGTSPNESLQLQTAGGTNRMSLSPNKTLVNNTVTSILNCTLASNSAIAGFVEYSVEVSDGTDIQIEEGVISYHCINKGGAFSANTTVKANNQQAMTAGTLTVTWTITAANPAVLQVNANSSLTPSATYPKLRCIFKNLTDQAIALQ